jgi:hypothetical protein
MSAQMTCSCGRPELCYEEGELMLEALDRLAKEREAMGPEAWAARIRAAQAEPCGPEPKLDGDCDELATRALARRKEPKQ